MTERGASMEEEWERGVCELLGYIFYCHMSYGYRH